MNIKKFLSYAVKKLNSGKIEFPHLEAELLLSNVLNKRREFILINPEHKLNILQIAAYRLSIAKRLKGFPLAYIVKEKEFYGYNFFVNKNVLIPRPETELMIDEGLKILYDIKKKKQISIIDIGTGSGCILISIVNRLLNYKLQIKNYKFFASDISKKALSVARKNAKLHKVDKMIKFYKGDLLMPIIKENLEIRNCNLIILANLPYLTPSQVKNFSTIRHEPKSALIAGADGLKYYRILFRQIKKLIEINKTPLHLLCEIDPGQVDKIKKLALSLLPEFKLKIKKDLRGLNRLVILFN